MTAVSKIEMEKQHLLIREEATKLAGRPTDLIQRSSVYFHIYQHSQGNHVFPLLAAHGALWGSGHFAKGLKVGRILSKIATGKTDLKRRRLDALEKFALAFKEINRRVCVETYTSYHMTRIYGEHSDIVNFIPIELCEALNRCHHSNRSKSKLNDSEKKDLFNTFFLWEQDNIVCPGVDAAVAQMDWPLIMWLAMKPAIGFSYFGLTKRLWFSDFASKQERIEKGILAFEIARSAGWCKVEGTLGGYKIMPEHFLRDPNQYFANLKQSLLSPTK